MPLRFLLYLADLYSELIEGKNIYGKKIIPFPAPKFVVFYNGLTNRPEHETLHLSDAYITKEEKVSLELEVEVFNINIGHNEELLNACKTLKDYSEYVYRVRYYAGKMPIEKAVDKAIDECIQENILQEFLSKNRAEAKKMSIYEYDEEKHMKMEREEHFAEGFEEGRKEEMANTERERQRAEVEKARADSAEAELAKLRAEIARLKNLQ